MRAKSLGKYKINRLEIVLINSFYYTTLIYWNLLNFSEGISSFDVVCEYFVLTLGKIQLFENHLPRDDKLDLNQSCSKLSIGAEMLFQRDKVLGYLNNVFSISAKNTFDR